MRVIHVTESFGGGIVTSLRSLTMRQVEEGMQVSIVFLTRSDTPGDAELADLFGESVHLVRLTDKPAGIRGLVRLAAFVRSAVRSDSPDVLHLHSSKAGAVGRVAVLGARRRAKVFYSPHGYAFMRRDVNPVQRRGMLTVERALSRVGDGSILVSESERTLATERVHGGAFFVLQNGISAEDFPAERIPAQRVASSNSALVVAMIGRVTYQKAPWRFADVASALSHRASFTWIGAGRDQDVARWLPVNIVDVTGWLGRAAMRERLSTVDIVVFPTLWEGMPLALIEAQAMGIPVVASAVVGNVDVVQNGETGYLVDDDAELLEKTDMLLSDDALRSRMGSAARERARSQLTDSRLGTESWAIYTASTTRDRQTASTQGAR